MKARKTIDIKDIIEKANHYFCNSSNDLQRERTAMQFFVTSILMDTNNYRGFGYLTKDNVPVENTYGVEYIDNKAFHKDESRIRFY